MPIQTSPTRIKIANSHNITYTNLTQKSDLLDVNLTNTNLLLALQTSLNHGYRITITSVRSDHSDDSAIGPHGHARGYAIDCWCDDLSGFVQNLCTGNPQVMKVGLGGLQAQALTLDPGATEVFCDNNQPHIHFQVQ